MTRTIKARIKGCFRTAIATVVVDNQGNIEDVYDVEDITDIEDVELIDELYQIGG